MKKLFLFVLFFLSIAFWISYKFYHAPLSDVKIKYDAINGYHYLKYSWRLSNYILKKYDFSEILYHLKKIKYVSFFRYSYFWKRTFSKVKDDKYNFEYLDNKVLKYPVLWVGIDGKIILFVPKELVTNFSWGKYEGKDFKIVKYKNFYIFVKDIENNNFLFDLRKYVKILTKFPKIRIFTLQLWQNPLASIKVDNFSKYILWIEVKKNNKLIGLILDLWKRYNPSLTYSDSFYKDEQMVRNIRQLYDAVKKYYNMMWTLPQDLGSLYPNFFDITSFNKYWYKIVYKPLFPNKYTICFKPKSEEFKNLFWFYLDNDFWCETYKVF